MEHYFIEKEHKKEDYFVFEEKMFDRQFVFKSCDDVFSKDRVDYGTKVLIETIAKQIDLQGEVLDIGCGYGPIAIILGSIFQNATLTLTDINNTAVQLSEQNVRKNNITNIKQIIKSDGYQNIENKYHYIITNPPIKAGKQNLLSILDGAYEHLLDKGKLIFVIKKKHGEESVKKHLESIFSTVEILKRDSGYYILCCTKN